MRILIVEDDSRDANDLARVLRGQGHAVEVLQPQPRECAGRIVHGPLVMDRDARRVSIAGEAIALLPREWAVLEVLLGQPERVISKESIGRYVGGAGKQMSANTIETYVSRLRAKLEPAGIRIRTVHRIGYLLEAATPAETDR